MSSSASPVTEALVQQAESLTRAGRVDEAQQVWQRVLTSDPNHPRALFALGGRAFQRGDLKSARDLLQRAAAAAPSEPGILINLAAICRAMGDVAAELAALDRALVVDEMSVQAMVMKAALLERAGKVRAATKIYRRAVDIAPLNPPREMIAALAHGKELVQKQAADLEGFLRGKLSAHDGSWRAHDRFDDALGIASGTRKTYHHQPAQFYYPGLPAIGYYDDTLFPWLGELEAQSTAIRDELAGLIAEQMGDFAPYVAKPANEPVQQWGELNHSTKWSAYFLWQDGKKLEDHCARCPVTAAALAKMPMADMPGYAPTAFFSSLEPHVRIPAHSGSTNVRLIVHLPLILPEQCFFRVANETREWKFNKAWVFDDSIEHEAWNDSDRQRVILIFDVWNPLLSEKERVLISELQAALGEYYRDG